MIDLHCHILPGIDDGPPTLEGSIAICRAAARDGTGTLVATPHVNGDYPGVTAAVMLERAASLNRAVRTAGNLGTLSSMLSTVDGITRDWSRYQSQAVDFHLRNARAWANGRTGEDLEAQVDPEFVLGPGVSTSL